MRWRRLAHSTVKRVKILALERQAKPSKGRWVIIRNRDGKTWAGPYRWQGQTFTASERFWYQFNNVDSANAAIIGNGFVGVSVLQIV